MLNIIKGCLILNDNYKKSKVINEVSFTGLIENVSNAIEALQEAKKRWDLRNTKNVVLEECKVEMV